MLFFSVFALRAGTLLIHSFSHSLTHSFNTCYAPGTTDAALNVADGDYVPMSH